MTDNKANIFPESVQYVGFFPRMMAMLLDTGILMLPISFVCGIVFNAFPRKVDVASEIQAMGTPTTNEQALQMLQQLMSNPDFLGRWIFENTLATLVSATLVILCWYFFSATPGKMIMGMKIVDATTGKPPTKTQDIKRYMGYFVSIAPFFIGFSAIAWSPRKQGWHDKMANTVVVYKNSLPADLAEATEAGIEFPSDIKE